MKKTVATLAIMVSASSASSAHAIVQPPGGTPPPLPQTRTICLSELSREVDGSVYLNTCDESLRNERWERPTLANGCASEQFALKVTDASVQIAMCPTYVQL